MGKIKTFNVLILITVIILIFISIGYLSIRKNEKAVISEAIDAVPLDAALILENDNILALQQNIFNHDIIKQILNVKQLLNLKEQLSILDTIINNSNSFKYIFKKNRIIISAHSIKNDGFEFLFAFNVYPKKKQKLLNQEFLKYTNTDSLKNISYSSTKIFSFQNKFNQTYYYCITQNICLISKSLSLLKSSIRQKQSDNPISLDLGFKEATLLSQNKTHIYINYNNLSDYVRNLFSGAILTKSKNVKNIANWSAFDLFVENNSFSLVGNTYCPKSADKYLDMFNNSEPQKFDAQSLIPYKTAEFLFLSTNNMAKFYSKYEKYLSSKNLLTKYKKLADEYKTKNNINIQPSILPLLDKSFLFVKVNFNSSLNEYSKYVILRVTNINDFKKIIDKISNYNTLDFVEKNIDNNKKIKIYNLGSDNFLNILIGELAYFPDLNCFTYYKNYVIFGKTNTDVKNYYNAIYRKKTLAYNSEYKKFETSIASKANIIYYSNNNFNAYSQIESLKSKYQNIYNQNLKTFKNFQFITLQYAYEKDNIFKTYINAFQNINASNNGLTVWETELKNNVKTKPFFFINHYTFEKEIFLSDNSNIVYLIDKKGEILWKKKLNEPIVGNIEMLDLYNNKKYQLCFSTKKHILTIDRNGKPIKEKTAILPDSTKFGITVVDYNKNKDYRIFVPCLNNEIYLYNANMKQVDGWNIPKTSSSIVSRIYYFNYADKDYIVFGEKSRIHILNRKGEERIKINKNFTLPNNAHFYFQNKTQTTSPSFVTTDASGNVVSINMNGTISIKKLITVSANHTFIASDIDNDDKLDYILTDGKNLFVYKNSGEELFSYTFDKKINTTPIVLRFSAENIKIGINSNNKIYLFNLDGTIENNFPVQGNSLFSVGFLSSKEKFSLIVGNNNYLYNYIIF